MSVETKEAEIAGRLGGVFVKTTKGIKVTAMPMYLTEQSSPDDAQFVWAYTIRIENNGTETAQLLNRKWQITDANGQMQTVEGPGVVGEQPVLEPGHSYQYTSGTVLPTPSGLMSGSYDMEKTETNERFSVGIPAFSLDSPQSSAAPKLVALQLI